MLKLVVEPVKRYVNSSHIVILKHLPQSQETLFYAKFSLIFSLNDPKEIVEVSYNSLYVTALALFLFAPSGTTSPPRSSFSRLRGLLSGD